MVKVFLPDLAVSLPDDIWEALSARLGRPATLKDLAAISAAAISQEVVKGRKAIEARGHIEDGSVTVGRGKGEVW